MTALNESVGMPFLRRLVLDTDITVDDPLLNAPALRSVSLAVAKSLSTYRLPWGQLTHLYVTDSIRNYSFGIEEEYEMFSKMPNLEVFETAADVAPRSVRSTFETPTGLPKLRKLVLPCRSSLDYLLAPALEHVEVKQGTWIGVRWLTEFIQASSCSSIKILHIENAYAQTVVSVRVLFSYLPALMHLSLTGDGDDGNLPHFFEALEITDYREIPSILPQLETLSIMARARDVKFKRLSSMFASRLSIPEAFQTKVAPLRSARLSLFVRDSRKEDEYKERLRKALEINGISEDVDVSFTIAKRETCSSGHDDDEDSEDICCCPSCVSSSEDTDCED